MNNVLDRISFVLGMISILYYYILLAFNYKIGFSKFFVLLGLILILVGLCRQKLNLLFKNTNKKLLNFIRFFIAILLMSFVIIEGLIISNSLKQNKNEQDCGQYVLVLGAGLNGKRPSNTLKQRLDTTLDFIKNNNYKKIIVSGGQVRGEEIPEAEAMEEYLIKHGVSKEKIIKEDKSKSTFENMKFTRKKLEDLNIINKDEDFKINLITSDFHMFRSELIAKKFKFLPCDIPSKSLCILKPSLYVREYFSIVKMIIKNLEQKLL